MDNLTLYEFLDKVCDGYISNLEIINYVEKITDNYRPDKTQSLIKEVKEYESRKKVEIEYSKYRPAELYSKIKNEIKTDSKLDLSQKYNEIDDYDYYEKFWLTELITWKPKNFNDYFKRFFWYYNDFNDWVNFQLVDISELIIYLEDKNKKHLNEPYQESNKKRFENLKHDYYVFVELLATGELIQLSWVKFKFNGKEYNNDAIELNKAINDHFEFEKNLYPYIRQLNIGGKKDILKGTSSKFNGMKNHLESQNIKVENIKHQGLKDKLSNIKPK